ncbi:MAG: protein kinase [Deltaproteobacteria bacterium]|nr:protein kinase [Deltaproteobacteria bacterium]
MEPGRKYGSYVLVDLLGKGGMGQVWRARHGMLGRTAAVKLIRWEMLGADEARARQFLRRFEREAQATSSLRSPHTVAVYDYGVAADGTFYYAMELLEGLNLEQLVTRHGPVSPERAVYLLAQACDSLAEAHAQGLIHRDVKPANLYACRLGLQHDFVKVLDFGLVKPIPGSGMLETSLTIDGTALGSPAFMPPEVAEGKRTIDARADIYALGCVAYWLLTGQYVFDGDSPLHVIARHLTAPPPPPSSRTAASIPPALEELVLECLRKEPDERPGGARALLRRLRGLPLGPAWTPERAEAWWAEHDPAAVQPTPRPDASAATEPRPSPLAPGKAPFLPPPVVPAPAPVPPPVAEPPESSSQEIPIDVEPSPLGRPEERAPRPGERRVSKAQRQQAIQALQEQYVQSNIDATELGRRVRLAESAIVPGDLDRLLDDLPEMPGALAQVEPAVPAVPAASASAAAPAAPAPAGADHPMLAPVDVPVDESGWYVAVFGGKERKGQWYAPKTIRMAGVFGGTMLDFRDAKLQPGMTKIQALATFGGCEIIVPPGLHVDINGVAIFGGFDETAGSNGPPPSGATPWLKIRGLALFGGVEVRVAEPGVSLKKLRRHGPPGLPPHRRRGGRDERDGE